MADGSANASSAARSSGSAKPALIVASASASYRWRYSARDGYSCARRAAANGFVEPSSRQIVERFGPGAPESAATGTSTGGVRMPPSAIPSGRAGSSASCPRSRRNGAMTEALPVVGQTVSAQRHSRDDVHRAVVDRHAAIDGLRVRADEMRVGVRGAGDLPEAEPIAVGLTRRVRVEDAGDVGLGLDVSTGASRFGIGSSVRPIRSHLR